MFDLVMYSTVVLEDHGTPIPIEGPISRVVEGVRPHFKLLVCMLRSALRALVGTRMMSMSIFAALEGTQTFVTPAVSLLRLKAVNVHTAIFHGSQRSD